MKKTILAAAASLALSGAMSSALAADLPGRPYVAPSLAPVAYSWAGGYIGVHVGWGSADKTWTQGSPAAFLAGGNSASFTADGVIGGGQIGYNWQTGSIVFGVEIDVTGSDMSGSATQSFTPSWRSATDINWLGTITGRVGFAWDRALLYAKGGFAWADEDHFQNFTPAGGVAAEVSRINTNHTGWTVGAGVEMALWENWSGKVEYNYIDLGAANLAFLNIAPAPGARSTDIWNIDQQIHMVKVGANYRFKW
jgi:outer membrane immunogenic protein